MRTFLVKLSNGEQGWYDSNLEPNRGDIITVAWYEGGDLKIATGEVKATILSGHMPE